MSASTDHPAFIAMEKALALANQRHESLEDAFNHYAELIETCVLRGETSADDAMERVGDIARVWFQNPEAALTQWFVEFRKAEREFESRQQKANGRSRQTGDPGPGHDTERLRLNILPYACPDPAAIPRRSFLGGGKHYKRGSVSATIAAGGRAKSTLTMTEATGMAAGKDLLDHQDLDTGALRVGYLNAEEDQDELDRRFAAILQRYSLTNDSLGGRLFVKSLFQTPLHLAVKDPKGEFRLNRSVIDALVRFVVENHLDVLIADPLVSFHRVSENLNEHMDPLIKEGFGAIAQAGNCAVELVHHRQAQARPNRLCRRRLARRLRRHLGGPIRSRAQLHGPSRSRPSRYRRRNAAPLRPHR
jgi:hypothetical protein